MRLAKRVGFDVAKHVLVRDRDGMSGLLVERLDTPQVLLDERVRRILARPHPLLQVGDRRLLELECLDARLGLRFRLGTAGRWRRGGDPGDQRGSNEIPPPNTRFV